MLSTDMALFALNNTPMAVYWIDTDARILDVNPAAETALGYTRDALLTMRLSDFSPGFERGIAYLLPFLRREGKALMETPHRRADGVEYPVELTLFLARHGGKEVICGMARDISDRKWLEGRGDTSLARYREALDTPILGFWALDLSGRVLEVNQAYIRQSGYSREELIRMRVEDLLADSEKPKAQVVRERLMTRKADHFRSVHRRADGSLWPCEVAINYSTVNGGIMFVFILDITEHVAKEKELAEKSHELETLVVRHREAQEIAKVGHFFYDFTRDVWQGSQVLDAIFGMAPMAERTAETWSALIHPEDRANVDHYLREQLTARDGFFDTLYRVVDQGSGVVKWVHSKGVLRYGENGEALDLFGTLQDVTDLKTMEEALLASERLKRQILDAIPDLVFLKDEDGKFLACNPVFERAVGAREEEILGRDDFDFVDAETAAFFRAHDKRVMEVGVSLVNEEWLTFADSGRRVLLETIKTPVRDEEGRIMGVLGLSRDITERKRIEDALREAVEELRRSNADLDAFAHVASHDLREPLRSVASFSTLLTRSLGGKLDEEQRDYLRYVHDGAVRMDRLIHDLLDYSRVGRANGSQDRTALDPLLTDVLDRLKGRIAEHGAHVARPPSLPTVTANRGDMERLFLNLIGNALKYSAPDRPPEITIGCERRGVWWEFSVRDNGIGIDLGQGFDKRIFRLFQRLHGREDYGGGTGVGLSICKKIVETYGGRIWVDSRPDEGATFRFTLPDTAERRQGAGRLEVRKAEPAGASSPAD